MPYRPAHRRRSVTARLTSQVLIGAGVVGALIASVVAGPSSAAAPYTAQGSIDRAAPGGIGTTDTEFVDSCPTMPSTQGQDGYVFALPAEVAVAGSAVRVSGVPETNNLGAHIYTGACAWTRTVSPTTSTDVPFTLAAGERFVSVYTTAVAVPPATMQVTLTVTPPGGGGTPTASASASASASPSASPSATASPTAAPTTRGSYPVTPNDPLFLQDGADDPILAGQWGMRTIHAPEAWQEARSTGAGIKVAVIDSGLDLDHEDFACPGKVLVVPNSDPDPDQSNLPSDNNGHGTHVAGIVGACTNNNTGVVGVAPDSTIMPIQGLSDATPVEQNVSQLAGAIDTAVENGAHVVNMSLGFGATGHVGTAAFLTSSSYAPIEAAIERAVAAGVVVVAAAGNDTSPLCGFPAIAEDVICVGSSDKRDVNSWYGNFPVKLDSEDTVGPALLAPGGAGEPVFCDFSAEDILSTWDVDIDRTEDDCDGLEGYKTIEGTSMASPHVAGVAALVYDRIGGVRSGTNGAMVVEALLGSAVDLYGPGYDPASGYGRVDALAAVRHFDAAPEPTPTAVAQPTRVQFTSAVPSSGQYSDSLPLEARLTDAAGGAIAGEPLTFQLLSHDEFRQVEGITDASGIARATLTLDTPPGAYDVLVGYAGKKDTWQASSAGQPFTVNKEDTATTLAVSGGGSKRNLTATVADGDDPARKVAGVVVSFYADGQKIGEAVTNESGVATLTASPGSRGSSTAYQARFAGNSFYLASASG